MRRGIIVLTAMNMISANLNSLAHNASIWQGIRLAKTRGESKSINSLQGPAVIISSSGMMTVGRILHHLRQRLPDPKNTIILGGFSAPWDPRENLG